MSIKAIDFGYLYYMHMRAAGGREKPAAAWDARAAKMKINSDSPYTRDFIAKMDLEGCTSLLDMGCGTGAIALALASQLEQVVAVDYSAGMLAEFSRNAQTLGVNNIATIQRAWEECWQDIPVCDLVIASRSTAVMDMADALQKLDSKARKRVYLTNLVGGSFFDASLLSALGRHSYAQPDYIYILNILYQMGRQPRLDYISAPARRAKSENYEAFLLKAIAALGPLSLSEQQRLADWYHSADSSAARDTQQMKWAFISWETAS